MHLLILTPEFMGEGGGIMTFYRALAPILRERGVTVRVLEGSALHATEIKTVRSVDGIIVETLERSRIHQWLECFPAFAALPLLRRHLAAAWAMWEQAGYGVDADVIEASDWGLLFLPPTIEAKQPLIVQCHGSIGQIAYHDPIVGEEAESLVVRLIERAALNATGSVLTHSDSNAAFWRAETNSDVDMIRPAWAPGLPAASGSPSDKGLVIGRVQRWKGPEILCGALELLGSRAPCCDWFGRDTPWGSRQSSSMAHLAQTFPSVWGAKLLHHAPISVAEVARRQATAWFNLVPSTWDVFNFTAVEAMASGRPTIVSTGAGASELIQHGVNGFVFASGDADALAATIDQVMKETPERLAEIGRAGHDTVQLTLDPKAIVEQRIAAYNSAIGQFARHPPASVGGWLGDICRPTKKCGGEELAFLEHQPLRALAGHVMSRISRRVSHR